MDSVASCIWYFVYLGHRVAMLDGSRAASARLKPHTATIVWPLRGLVRRPAAQEFCLAPSLQSLKALAAFSSLTNVLW